MGATHEELRTSRGDLAAKNWRLILPDSEPHRQETDNVLVYGSRGSGALVRGRASGRRRRLQSWPSSSKCPPTVRWSKVG